MAQVDRWLGTLVEQKGSDLHLSAGRPPLLRLHGELHPLERDPLQPAALRALLEEITPAEGAAAYKESGDHDFAYAIPGVARFRVNLFVQEHGPGAVLRVIPEKILTLEDLKAPPVLGRLADLGSGLA